MAYPTTIDSLTTTHADGVQEIIHASDVNALATAVVAIETELGTLPKGGSTDVKTRIAATETVANAAVPKSTVTTAGDLIYATGNAAVTRLGIGNTNQLLVAGASAPSWGMRITTSAMSGGPPASPTTGDIWIATAVDGNGTAWHFQYDSTQTTYKWIFIGGPAVRSDVDTDESTSSTTYVDLATVGPSITVARAGDYQLRFGATMYNATTTSTGHIYISPKKGASATSDNDSARLENPASTNSPISVSRERSFTGMSAADVIKLQARAAAGTGHFMERWLSVTPVRVI